MNLHSHSSADGHLGSFYFWPMINDALMNICVQVFFCGSTFSILLGIYIEVEFLGLYGHSMFNILRSCLYFDVFLGHVIFSRSALAHPIALLSCVCLFA